MINIFSSFANDIIVYKDNANILGGPALWIKTTLQMLGKDYRLYTGENPGIVHINKDGNGEDKGTIIAVDEIIFHAPKPNDLVLVSTLRNELCLKDIQNLPNTIFIDIQGFLRSDGGKKNRFDCRSINTNGTVIVKATRQEFSYLDHHEDTNHIYVITNGGDDIEILSPSIDIAVPVQSGYFIDTIGAGDTFFASLAAYYEDSGKIKQSIAKASNYTYQFLLKKNTIPNT